MHVCVSPLHPVSLRFGVDSFQSTLRLVTDMAYPWSLRLARGRSLWIFLLSALFSRFTIAYLPSHMLRRSISLRHQSQFLSQAKAFD